MGTIRRGRIAAIGTGVPNEVMTNADFEKILDTSNEWILTRTGIRERHIAPKESDYSCAGLGTEASRKALERADVAPEQVDGIICATVTPDFFYPSTACRIQAALGCKKAFAFDCMAACAGFTYALTIANSFIGACRGSTYLAIGSEIMSRTIDWSDRSTAILFGDGAGAAVIQATDEPGTGILAANIESDGNYADILKMAVWDENRAMMMRGNEVFKHAVRMMSDILARTIAAAGCTFDEIDYVIPHQANIRIIKAIGETLNLPAEKVFINIDRYGNTSSASIPLALGDLWDSGAIKKGTTVAFTALGGGLATGSAVVRF
ncbi:MAG: ketoacyl-ACP synthase III [Chitinispirillaceae bacterium]|nr:ketoacyl-ACP synthase III [Chitinispirillaceae bacterium]